MTDKMNLETLGDAVAKLSKTVVDRLHAAGCPKPSFAVDSPGIFPPDPDIQQPRLQLIEALTDMLFLATGASDYLFLHGGLFLHYDATVLDILNQFDFFSKVPLCGSASYGELAQATSLPENLVRRILRYAFTIRFFAPETPAGDRVVHSAFSAHAARTPVLRSWLGHHLEEVRPAAVQAPEALRRFQSGKKEPTEELDETAFGLSWPPLKDGRLANFWGVLQDDPKEAWRATRFAEAMQASVLSAVVQADDVVDKFDWAALGAATVVDVGGSDGSLATVLARKHPKLSFIVQDLPSTEAEFNAHKSADVGDRVKFQAQDFFHPQPQHADVFLMKHVLHNWSDKYAVQVLTNLVTALNPGGRIIVCDSVIPTQESLPLNVRKAIAAADVHMSVMLNASERTLEHWEQTAKRADERLRVAKVYSVTGAIVSLIELTVAA